MQVSFHVCLTYMLVWIFLELDYQQALVDLPFLHDHIPYDSSKEISVQAYVYHPEAQV